MQWADVDWGSAGDWVASCVALVAIFTTIWMWRRDRANYRKEANDRAITERRREAGSVGAWLDGFGLGSDTRLVMWNQSAEPVYQWRVELFVDPPAKEYVFDSGEFSSLPPYGGRFEIPLDEVARVEIQRVEINLTYTMPDGGVWHRGADGALRSGALDERRG